MQAETNCCFCWAWGCLAKAIRHTEASRCLFGVVDLQKIWGKFTVEAEAGHLYGEALKQLWPGEQVVGQRERVSGNHEDGENDIIQVNPHLI